MKKRKISYLLVFSTLIMQLYYSVMPVYAFSLAISVIWEVLQVILLSAGITYTGCETLQIIKDHNLYKESVQSIVYAMNESDSGLGDILQQTLEGIKSNGISYDVSIDSETWTRILDFSRVVSDTNSFSVPMDTSVLFPVADSVILNSVPLIMSDNLPYSSNDVRIRSYDVENSIELWTESWEAFMQYAKQISGVEQPVMNTFYVSQYNDRVDGSFNIVCVVTEGNVGISSYSLTLDNYEEYQGSGTAPTYVHFYDVEGNELNYILYKFPWDRSENRWGAINFLNSYQQLNNGNISWYDYYGLLQYGWGVVYFQHLISNSYVSVPASVIINTGIKSYIADGIYDVVTPNRTQTTTGQLEGDISISIPLSFPVTDEIGKVITGDVPVTDVLQDVKVIPVDTTNDKVIGKDETISDAISGLKPIEVPKVDEFDLSLQNFFPFCIPFDFAEFISVLQAEPQAPTFTFKFPVGYDEQMQVIYEEYEIDFSQFDEVAYWVRKMELLLFIVGLIFSTRSYFLRS